MNETDTLSLFNPPPATPSWGLMRLQLGLKLVAIVVCTIVIFSGHYPPVMAQSRRPQVQTIPVLTIEDAVQDTDIAAANKHLEATDANVARLGLALEKAESDISGMQGEERGVGIFLALLSGLQIFLQLRRKPE